MLCNSICQDIYTILVGFYLIDALNCVTLLTFLATFSAIFSWKKHVFTIFSDITNVGPSDRFPFGWRGQKGVRTDDLLSPAAFFTTHKPDSEATRRAALWPAELATWQRPSSYKIRTDNHQSIANWPWIGSLQFVRGIKNKNLIFSRYVYED